MSRPSEKVGGHVPRVPHQIAPMPSCNCSSSVETQALLCNICPSRLLLQFIRGIFQQKALVFFSFCFSCLWDVLRSRAETNAT